MNAHREVARCRPVIRHSQERFMSSEQESGLGEIDAAGPEVQVWWRFFRFLAPQLGSLDDSQLRSQYSPCKYFVLHNLPTSRAGTKESS